MKRLNEYLNESLLDDEDDIITNGDNAILIGQFLEDNYKITGTYNINRYNVVDVKGDISLINKSLTKLTNELFTFGTIDGSFDCWSSNVTTLEGGPKYVKDSFKCNYCNNLKSLKGAPKEVGSFVCSYSPKLKTIEGIPEIINGHCLCAGCNSLESLKGAPKIVKGYFNCSRNNSLESLEGLETKIGLEFIADECENLKVLNCPKAESNDSFYVHNCPNLISLEGMPKYIGGKFSFSGCKKVTDLTPLKKANVKKRIFGVNGNIIQPDKLK